MRLQRSMENESAERVAWGLEKFLRTASSPWPIDLANLYAWKTLLF
jgi:hypothetical protein